MPMLARWSQGNQIYQKNTWRVYAGISCDGGKDEGIVCFLLALRFLHGVRCEFTDDVSETAAGSIFTGHAYIMYKESTHTFYYSHSFS
jgi:hypothetical protein